jgi:ankyrin repeat protein
VAEGADVNVQDDGGGRPLHWAAYRGQVAAVRVLVELGPTKMHLQLTGRHRCTTRQIRGMWQ